MMITETRQFEFYTPTQLQKESDWLLPENLRGNKAFDRLVKKCLDPLREDSARRIRSFMDGGEAPSPFDKTSAEFTKEASSVISFYAKDFIHPDGSIDPKFSNLEEIAPSLIKIMTSPDNYIGLVQKVKTLNIIAAALQMAIDPDTQMSIRVGIGGSDDQFTPVRFASYGLPAFMIAEGIQQFFAQRKSDKLKNVAANDEIARREREKGSSFTPEEKKEVGSEVRAQIAQSGSEVFLTEERYQWAIDRYSLSDKTPRVQFVFATQAAIAINGTHKNPELIPVRTMERKQILKEFAKVYFPTLSDSVDLIEDLAWDQLDTYTRVTMEYFAHLISISDEPEVIKAREKSINRGQKHGGKSNDSLSSILYDVMHPLAFGDPINLPELKYLEQPPKPTVVALTLGGKPEREYCVLREYIERVVNPDEYLTYLKDRIDNPQNHQQGLDRVIASASLVDLPALTRIISVVERWKDVREAARPMYMVSLISTIGDFPPYFAHPVYDLAHGESLEDNIALLQAKKEEVLQISDVEERLNQLIPINGRLISLEALQCEISKRAA